MQTAPTTMTLEEWADLDDEVEGELVDGILVEEEVPSYSHEFVVAFLIRALMTWLGDRGWVASSDAKFAVARHRGRKPDVTAYLAGRRPQAEGLVRIPPDIAVEVISRRLRDQRRDRLEKFDEYAAFGVRWYWLVDPAARIVEIYELVDGRYVRAVGSSDAAIDPVPGCPGLTLDLPTLWRRLAELEAPDDPPTP